MEIKINTAFRNVGGWQDSPKRAEHVFDRMRSRGIGVDNIREAVQKGAKILRDDGSIISEFRWFKIVYREFHMGNVKKIYPITVMEA